MPTPPLRPAQLVEAVHAWRESGESPSGAARLLGIDRNTFKNRLRHAEAKGMLHKEPEADKTTYTHCVIPDCQVKLGVPLDHLSHAGQYIAEKRPDVIICIGDFGDLPSLSSYDKGKRAAENRRYKFDIEAVHQGMELLMSPIVMAKGYNPRLIMTLGNHEHRITRYGDDNPEMHESVGIKDLGYEAWGWEVYPFLEVVKVHGIEYSHFFTTGVMGRPANSAAAMLKVRQGSCTMGHVQTYDMAIHQKTQKRALMAGCFYAHNEDYLGPQGNDYRRHILFKHEVREGRYDLMEISLDYLKRRYS